MTARALIVGAARSGSGKTSVSVGLMRALRRRGLAVRGAKSGPDYIDPGFHAAATGAPGVNLDSWAMPPALLDRLAAEQAAGADVLVIESAMGLFDGIPAEAGRSGAAADLARRYGVPVLLVLDVSGQSQTAAAIARGFATHDPGVRIAGRGAEPGGERAARARWRATAVEALGLPVVGAVHRNPDMALPERHLGLVQAREHAALEAFIERLADVMAASLDLDAVLGARGAARRSRRGAGAALLPPPGQRIAIAEDAAFSFVYPHVARHWRAAGAELVPFSPLADEAPDPSLRRLLAAGRLSGAARRAAGGGGAVPRRAARGSRGRAAGARRVRRVHGARAGARGCRGRHAPDGRAARACHELRQAADEPRLPPGAARRRRADRAGGAERARARVPLFAAGRAGRRRAAGRALRRAGQRARAVGRAAGAGHRHLLPRHRGRREAHARDRRHRDRHRQPRACDGRGDPGAERAPTSC